MVQYALPLTGQADKVIEQRRPRRRRAMVRVDVFIERPAGDQADASRRLVGKLDLYRLTNGACLKLPGPCCRVSCRHNLTIAERTEQYVRSTPRTPTDSMCSIREAKEHGAMTAERVGQILGMGCARIYQIEDAAFRKIAARAPELRDVFEAVWSRPSGETYPDALNTSSEDDRPTGRVKVNPTKW